MIEQDSWVYDTTMNVVDRSDDELEDAITELNVRLAEYHEQHMDAPAEHKYLLGKLSELENMVRLRTFTALHRSINDADQHVVWEYRKRRHALIVHCTFDTMSCDV